MKHKFHYIQFTEETRIYLTLLDKVQCASLLKEEVHRTAPGRPDSRLRKDSVSGTVENTGSDVTVTILSSLYTQGRHINNN